MLSLALDGPSDAVPLALLADLKADLEITDNSSDARLNRLLLTASSLALDYIGRPIIAGEWQETIRVSPGEHLHEIVLSVFPVSDVRSIEHDGTLWGQEQLETLGLDAQAGLLSLQSHPRHGRWRHGLYIISYHAGFTPPSLIDGTPNVGTLPASISQAVLVTASALFSAGARDPNLKSESVQGVGSTSWNVSSGTGGLPQSAADMLEAYKGGHF